MKEKGFGCLESLQHLLGLAAIESLILHSNFYCGAVKAMFHSDIQVELIRNTAKVQIVAEELEEAGVALGTDPKVDYDANTTDFEEMEQAVEKAGYTVERT